MASTLWQQNESIAQLIGTQLRGQLDLNSPHQGLHQLACQRQSPSGTILGLHAASDPSGSLGPIEDCYVRADDLIAVYSQSEDRPQRTQVCWRYTELAENTSGVEMVVSVQTDLLDSLPELESETKLVAEEVLHLSDPSERTALPLQQNLVLRAGQGPCCVVVRLKDLPISYVEMEPALDFRELHTEFSGDQVSMRHRLFSQHLEKGVILRARICGMFVPRTDDLDTAAQCYEQLNRQELPLTT